MCGIAGIVGGGGDCSSNLANMIRAQAHRGPDGSVIDTYRGAARARAARLDVGNLGLPNFGLGYYRISIPSWEIGRQWVASSGS